MKWLCVRATYQVARFEMIVCTGYLSEMIVCTGCLSEMIVCTGEPVARPFEFYIVASRPLCIVSGAHDILRLTVLGK